jgi:hypothetical protein
MAAPASAYKDRQFLAVIGDEVGSVYAARLGFVLIDYTGFSYWPASSRYWGIDSFLEEHHILHRC